MTPAEQSDMALAKELRYNEASDITDMDMWRRIIDMASYSTSARTGSRANTIDTQEKQPLQYKVCETPSSVMSSVMEDDQESIVSSAYFERSPSPDVEEPWLMDNEDYIAAIRLKLMSH
jgi:hypothetical protein